MPIYEYACASCGKDFELSHKMADPIPTQGTGCSRSDCCLTKNLSRVAGVVRSPNPFAAAAHTLEPRKPTVPDTSHQCGSGCVLHGR